MCPDEYFWQFWLLCGCLTYSLLLKCMIVCPKHKHASENVREKPADQLYVWLLPGLAFAGPAEWAPVAPPSPATCHSESLKSPQYKRKGWWRNYSWVAILKCFLKYHSRHNNYASALLVRPACAESLPQVTQHWLSSVSPQIFLSLSAGKLRESWGVKLLGKCRDCSRSLEVDFIYFLFTSLFPLLYSEKLCLYNMSQQFPFMSLLFVLNEGAGGNPSLVRISVQ